MTALVSSLRPLRTDLIGVAGLAGLVLLVAGGIALRLLAFDIPVACFGEAISQPECLLRQYDIAAFQSFGSSWTGRVVFFAVAMPTIAGVIFGIALVGKELDQRTAGLAWSVDTSRRHWLLLRAAPLVGLLVVLGLLSARIVTALFEIAYPGQDVVAEQGFSSIAFSGFAPMAMGISAFGITALAGAMLGRLLPALLVAAAFVLGGLVLITLVNEQLMSGETLLVEQSLDGSVGQGRYIDSLLRGPDGQVVTWDYASNNNASGTYFDPQTGEMQPGVVQLAVIVPIEIFPQVAARYVLLHLLVGLMALTLTFAVVERRSP